MLNSFLLDTSHASDKRLFAGGQWVNDARQRCPQCRLFLEDSWPAVIEVSLNHLGKNGFVEHLWNSHNPPIFREDIVSRWKLSGLSGFVSHPVQIVGWHEKPKQALPEVIPTHE